MMSTTDETEARYQKARDSLEHSWEEIELLEQIIAEQESEIAELQAQLSKSMPRGGLESEASSAASTQSETISRLSLSSENLPRTDAEVCKLDSHSIDLLNIPIFAALAQKAKQVETDDLQIQCKRKHEKPAGPNERVGKNTCVLVTNGDSSTKQQHVCSQDQGCSLELLRDRDRKITELEKELEQLKQATNSKLEQMKNEINRLIKEKTDREERLLR